MQKVTSFSACAVNIYRSSPNTPPLHTFDISSLCTDPLQDPSLPVTLRPQLFLEFPTPLSLSAFDKDGVAVIRLLIRGVPIWQDTFDLLAGESVGKHVYGMFGHGQRNAPITWTKVVFPRFSSILPLREHLLNLHSFVNEKNWLRLVVLRDYLTQQMTYLAHARSDLEDLRTLEDSKGEELESRHHLSIAYAEELKEFEQTLHCSLDVARRLTPSASPTT